MVDASVSALIDWIIYYEDGGSFTSADGKPHEAPREGVQAVSCRHEHTGKLIWHSTDYYCWQGEWVPHNSIGLHRYLRLPGAEKVVLQGYGVPFRAFREVYDRAVDDQRLPFKTCRHPDEPPEPTL